MFRWNGGPITRAGWSVGWLVGWAVNEWICSRIQPSSVFSPSSTRRGPLIWNFMSGMEREREREKGEWNCWLLPKTFFVGRLINHSAGGIYFHPLFTCSEVCKLMCFFVCLSRHREHCQEETHAYAYDNRHNSGCQFGWTWLEDWTISFCPCKSKISYMIGHVCNPMYLIFKRVNADQ